MGNGDLREIDSGRMDPSGRSLTQAGRICGMIACILMILSDIATVLFFLLFAGAAVSGMQ